MPDNLFDVRRLAVHGALFAVAIESELGCDDDAVTERGPGFANEFFVREWAIDSGGVEKGDALFDSRANERDHFLLIGGWSVAEAHTHTAEAQS